MSEVRAYRWWLKCTHTVRFFCENSLLFCFVLLPEDWYSAASKHRNILFSTRFSTFASLVQSHLKAPSYLLSFLYFQESHQGHLKVQNHLRYSSLLYFRKSRQFRLFFTSQLWTVWRLASAQSGVTYSSSSAGLLCSLGSSFFPGLYNFLGAYGILVVAPLTSVLRLNTLVLHTTHAT